MTPFQQKTYELLRTVPKGRVTTYKALAVALNTTAYRAIGQFMRHNPFAPEVPCHRVVTNDGSIGGFMGKTMGVEIQKKIRLLRAEGVEVRKGKVIEFSSLLYMFH